MQRLFGHCAQLAAIRKLAGDVGSRLFWAALAFAVRAHPERGISAR